MNKFKTLGYLSSSKVNIEIKVIAAALIKSLNHFDHSRRYFCGSNKAFFYHR